MLKSYAIEDLRAGMVVGRDVMDESANILIGSGTVMTKELIYNLLDRPIFKVYIEEEAVIDIPGNEFLLDDDYIACYNEVYHKLEHMFWALSERGEFDAAELQAIMDERNFRELCD